jgi:hypothetical protein
VSTVAASIVADERSFLALAHSSLSHHRAREHLFRMGTWAAFRS